MFSLHIYCLCLEWRDGRARRLQQNMPSYVKERISRHSVVVVVVVVMVFSIRYILGQILD